MATIRVVAIASFYSQHTMMGMERRWENIIISP
jgi:hypothetical protein